MRIEYTGRVDIGTPITLFELREFVSGVDLDDDAEVFGIDDEPIDRLTVRPRAVDERLSNGDEREDAATFDNGRIEGTFTPGRSVQTMDRAVGVFVGATEGKGRGVTWGEAAAHADVDEESLRIQGDRAIVAGLLVVADVTTPGGPFIMPTINGAALVGYDVAKSFGDEVRARHHAVKGTGESRERENDGHLVGILAAEGDPYTDGERPTTGRVELYGWVEYPKLASLWDRGNTALNKALDRCMRDRRIESKTKAAGNVMMFRVTKL